MHIPHKTFLYFGFCNKWLERTCIRAPLVNICWNQMSSKRTTHNRVTILEGKYFDGWIPSKVFSETPVSIDCSFTKKNRIQKCLQMANLLYFKKTLAEVLYKGSVIDKFYNTHYVTICSKFCTLLQIVWMYMSSLNIFNSKLKKIKA